MEITFLQWLQTMHNPFLDTFFTCVTHLGDAGIFWIALAVICLLIPRERMTGLCMAVVLILGLIGANLILKPAIGRIRPYEAAGFTELLIEKPGDYSFPSGHTQAAFASAMVLFYFHRRIGIAALVLAGLIAFSRMYLFVHYPTDILGGILLACLWAFLTLRWIRPFLEKRLPASFWQH